jgi:hypothetical protein
MSIRSTLMAVLVGMSMIPVAQAADQAYTAEQLVEENLQARGGADRLRAITSMRTVGVLRLGGGTEAQSASFAVAPDKVRFEFSLQGMTAINAWDGRQAWSVQPFGGRRDPQKMSGDDAKGLIVAADIAGPLLDWKTKGSRLEYLGTELRVTFGNGDSRVVFLDPDHFLEIRIEDHQFVRGQEQVSITDVGEYAMVDGIYFPFEQGPVQIEKIELNTPIDTAMFGFPAAKP